MMKKAIAVFIVILTVLFCFPVTVFAVNNSSHINHKTHLQGLVTDENCETDFCGEFYCETCGKTYLAPVTYKDLGMPIINIEGSLEGMSKDKKKNVVISYSSESLSFTSDATLKWQGNTSINYPKKNYSLALLKSDGSKNKIKIVSEWGKQSKYCLKANWVDASQARNIVSGKILSQVIHSRNKDDELNELNNGGAVDGFPVTMYLNGKFLGLYTFNIPKDKWMFDMDDESKYQALLFGGRWSDSTALQKEISDTTNWEADCWDIEYCSTEDDEEIGEVWAFESMNNFIRFLINNDGEAFKRTIKYYTDVDRAIDTFIYVYFISAYDCLSKNMIWATYNGTRWIPCLYDMDGSWGLKWDGSVSYSPSGPNLSGSKNLLFQRLIDNYYDEIKARYIELRNSVLNVPNICKTFSGFFNKIPDFVYEADFEKWQDIPSQTTNNYAQIKKYATDRIYYLDKFFKVSITEPGYNININCPHGDVYIYNVDGNPELNNSTVSINPETGVPAVDGSGQVTFSVKPQDEYNIINSVIIAGKNSGMTVEADSEKINTYHINNITDNITVLVKFKKSQSFVSLSPAESSTTVVDVQNRCISGIAPKLNNLKKFAATTENDLDILYGDELLGTGTTVYITENGDIVDTYKILLYGDVDGDARCDANDALIVNMLINGMLTREQVGEIAYRAADCNHDGVVDDKDYSLLVSAGLMLETISQTEDTENLLIQSEENIQTEILSLPDIFIRLLKVFFSFFINLYR